VAKKKDESSPEPKRYGTLIRVSDEFAGAIKDAASFQKLSIADFADSTLLPVVSKAYQEAVFNEASRLQRIQGKGGAK
jgi:hypothetical protein